MRKPSLDRLLDGPRRGSRGWRWLRRFLLLLLAAVLAGVVATWLSSEHFTSFGGTASGARLERMRASGHFKDGAFVNAETTRMMIPGENWGATREFLFGDAMRVPTCPLPMATGTATTLATPPASGLRITWLGHSTTLIELDGVNILTDPQWSERASPSTWAGPKRFHPPPLALAALPRIDAVLISHDHFDHLDMATVRALAARGAHFWVGLAVGAHLERWGVPPAQITELDWWESAPLPGGVTATSAPGRHFSGRRPWGRDGTLWTSWALAGPQHRVFFSGDTGMHAAFGQIADRLGPFDVALLEIGQYHPSWGDIHLGPRGALEAHRLLRAKWLLPIHWGTFELGLHAWSEPAETLYLEAPKTGARLLTPLLGAPVEPGEGAATSPWWRALPPTAPACPR